MKSLCVVLAICAVCLAGCSKDSPNGDGGTTPVMTGKICWNGYCITPQVPTMVEPPKEPELAPPPDNLTVAKKTIEK